MKKTNNPIFSFLLHYGISLVLVLMLAAIGLMLQNVEIKNKAAVDLLRHPNGTFTAYVTKDRHFAPAVMQTLQIDTDDKQELSFRITAVSDEPSYHVLYLVPLSSSPQLDNVFRGNSRLSGHIFAGHMRLWQLIFSRWTEIN